MFWNHRAQREDSSLIPVDALAEEEDLERCQRAAEGEQARGVSVLQELAVCMGVGQNVFLLACSSEGEASFLPIKHFIIIHIEHEKDLLLRIGVVRQHVHIILTYLTELHVDNLRAIRDIEEDPLIHGVV